MVECNSIERSLGGCVMLVEEIAGVEVGDVSTATDNDVAL